MEKASLRCIPSGSHVKKSQGHHTSSSCIPAAMFSALKFDHKRSSGHQQLQSGNSNCPHKKSPSVSPPSPPTDLEVNESTESQRSQPLTSFGQTAGHLSMTVNPHMPHRKSLVLSTNQHSDLCQQLTASQYSATLLHKANGIIHLGKLSSSHHSTNMTHQRSYSIDNISITSENDPPKLAPSGVFQPNPNSVIIKPNVVKPQLIHAGKCSANSSCESPVCPTTPFSMQHSLSTLQQRPPSNHSEDNEEDDNDENYISTHGNGSHSTRSTPSHLITYSKRQQQVSQHGDPHPTTPHSPHPSPSTGNLHGFTINQSHAAKLHQAAPSNHTQLIVKTCYPSSNHIHSGAALTSPYSGNNFTFEASPSFMQYRAQCRSVNHNRGSPPPPPNPTSLRQMSHPGSTCQVIESPHVYVGGQQSNPRVTPNSGAGSNPPTSRTSPPGSSGDSGVHLITMSDVETLMRRRDAELGHIRQTMERNEVAMTQAFEEKKAEWLHEISYQRSVIGQLESALQAAGQRAKQAELTAGVCRKQLNDRTVELQESEAHCRQLQISVANNELLQMNRHSACWNSDQISSPKSADSETFNCQEVWSRQDSKTTRFSSPDIPPDADLNTQVLILRQALKDQSIVYEQDKAKWLAEKAKVIGFQKHLQLNYIQLSKKTQRLEAEVQQLTLELERKDMLLLDQEEKLSQSTSTSFTSSTNQADNCNVKFRTFSASQI